MATRSRDSGANNFQSFDKEKVNETIAWLRKVLCVSSTDTLQFEFSDSTIEILQKIKQLNTSQTSHLDTLIEERKQNVDALIAETARIDGVLNRFNISEEKLSGKSRETFDMLIDAADIINSGEFSETAFFANLLRFRDQKLRIADELDEARSIHNQLTQECASITSRIEKVQAVKSKLEAEKVEASARLRKLRDERSSLKQKCADYRNEKRTLRNKLNDMQFSIHHPVIVRDAEKLRELRESVRRIELDYLQFENLSPNVEEARKMVTESRALLDARTTQLSRLLHSAKLN